MTRGSGPERWSPGISLGRGSAPMEAVGGLFAMSKDAVLFIFRRPFQWRGFLVQWWFVGEGSPAPPPLVGVPLSVFVGFTLHIFLWELGAPPLGGAGAAV